MPLAKRLLYYGVSTFGGCVPLRFQVRKIAEEKGKNQSQLARDSGVSFSTVNDVFNDKTVRVDLSVLDRLGKALGVDPRTLLLWEPDENGKRRKGARNG